MIVLIIFFCLLVAVLCLDRTRYNIRGGSENKDIIEIFKDPKFRELFKNALSMTMKSPMVMYDDIKYKYPYKEKSCFVRVANANGQRKLGLEEIQFLTKYHGDIDLLIYAGSAPGYMHGFVSHMFPGIKLILIDPTDHSLMIGDIDELMLRNDRFNANDSMYDNYESVLYFYDNNAIHGISTHHTANIYDFENDKILKLDRKLDMEKIKDIMKRNKFAHTKSNFKKFRDIIQNTKYKFFIFQTLFSNELATFMKESLDGLRYGFTSDIRSREDAETMMNRSIMINLTQQLDWTMILQPAVYKLKFRLPFEGVNTDPLGDTFKEYDKKYKINTVKDYKNGVLSYLDGDIYLQPWAPRGSTETRLIGRRENLTKPFKKYNEAEYAARFFYYNYVHRPFVVHENKYFNPEMGIDKSADSALEIQILEEYKNKVKDINILKLIKFFNKVAAIRKINYIMPHGTLVRNLTYEDYKRLFNKYEADCPQRLPEII